MARELMRAHYEPAISRVYQICVATVCVARNGCVLQYVPTARKRELNSSKREILVMLRNKWRG